MPSEGTNIFIILSDMNDKDPREEEVEEEAHMGRESPLMRMLQDINKSVKDSGDRTSPSPS